MTQGRNDSAPTIICETGMCSVSRSINFYRTSHRMIVLFLCSVSRFYKISHRMMVLLLASGERQATEKLSFERHCNVHFVSTEVYRCHKFNNCTLFLVLNLHVFLSERRDFADNKISI